MDKVQHIITKSEIKYGVLSIRKFDGTKEVFFGLPKRFTIRLRRDILYERQIIIKIVWMGVGMMSRFKPGQFVTIMKYRDEIIIE